MHIRRPNLRLETGRRAAREASGTARHSVYRLTIDPTLEAMTAALLPDYDTSIENAERADCLMVTATGRRVRQQVHWRPNYQQLTGIDVVLDSSNPFAVVLIAVDDIVYAITFGSATHLLNPECVDSGFGLRFAARVLNPDQISELISNTLTGKSRVESTIMAGGAPIAAFGNLTRGNLVRKLAGKPKGFVLPTAGRLSSRPARIVGADYLSLSLGQAPEDMVSDLREITKIYEAYELDPRLEWTSWIRCLDKRANTSTIAELDLLLARELGDEDPTSVGFAIPINTLSDYDEIGSFKIRTGRSTRRLRTLDREDILDEVRLLPPEDRVRVLRQGWVQPCSDLDCKDKHGPQTSAISWLSCEIAIGSELFVLIEGNWYRIGAAHMDNIRNQVAEILDRSTGLPLPAWPRRYSKEEDYLKKVVAKQARHLRIMDRKLVRSKLHWHGIEACDALHYGDAAVYHFKKAAASSPLSHLFAQAVVAHDANHNDAESRAAFAKQVKRHHKIDIDEAFRPQKIVLAIKWKDGQQLTAATMPTFAQIALLYAVNALRGVDVYVVSINST